MNRPTRIALFGVSLTFAVALSSCAGATSTSTSSPSSGAPASTSGSPGGMMSSSPGSMMSSSGGMMSSSGGMMTGTSAVHNDADVAFAQQMIVHHEGAVSMSDLAPNRASSSQVKELAVAIKAAQGPEITQMTGWLARWLSGMGTVAATSDGMGGMGGMTGLAMPGMMSDDQMTQLTAASGAAFDKLFLQLMITHHQGALTMAQTEEATGKNPDALALAGSIITIQTAQISAMQDLLNGM